MTRVSPTGPRPLPKGSHHVQGRAEGGAASAEDAPFGGAAAGHRGGSHPGELR